MSDEEMLKRIEDTLQEIRPNMQMDGGDVFINSLNGGVIELKFEGACVRSPISFFAIKEDIEQRLRDQVPELPEIVTVR
jgi:Fe-S cluster biogenesis protein NfuA